MRNPVVIRGHTHVWNQNRCSCGHAYPAMPEGRWETSDERKARVRAMNRHLAEQVKAVEPDARVFFDLARAAKAVGKTKGAVGYQGGWIYKSPTAKKPICQGWAAYGVQLIHTGELREVRDGAPPRWGQKDLSRHLGAWVVPGE
jgi:hypothetical protein